MLTTASGRMNRFPNFAQTPGSGRFNARMISFARCSASSEESKRPAQIRSPLLRWRKTATVCASGIGAGTLPCVDCAGCGDGIDATDSTGGCATGVTGAATGVGAGAGTDATARLTGGVTGGAGDGTGAGGP